MMARAKEAFWKKLGEAGNLTAWVTKLGFPLGLRARRAFFEPAKIDSKQPVPSFWFPIWSWDRPPSHGGTGQATTRAVLEALGLPDTEFLWLPSRSPDIHKIIEHTLARLITQFETWYQYDPQPYATRAYKEVLKHLFYNCPAVASAAVITNDVWTLPLTLLKIMEALGGDIPHIYR